MASYKKLKSGWQYRISYKDENGKYRTKSKNGFRTKGEAQQEAIRIEEELKNGVEESADRIIFADYFEEWCETHKLEKFSVSTDEKYLREIRYVREFFKNIKLSEITRKRLQDYIDHRGTNNGYDTVQKSLGRLKSCIDQALADNLIQIDPTYNISLNYDLKPSTRIKYWNLDDSHKLLKQFTNHIEFKNIMLYIALTCGLRIGEVYALSWKSFDFDENTLSISKSYDYNYTRNFTEGKTFASNRKIVVTDEFVNIIKQYKIKVQKEHPEYLFLDVYKNPVISHTGLTKYLKTTCKRLGIEELNIHSLRHTHSSVLIYKGISIHYISKRLGHQNVTETLKTYSHIIDEFEQMQNEKVIEVLEALES